MCILLLIHFQCRVRVSSEKDYYLLIVTYIEICLYPIIANEFYFRNEFEKKKTCQVNIGLFLLHSILLIFIDGIFIIHVVLIKNYFCLIIKPILIDK